MIGQTISHYKILDKLGEGGMGVVYKAHDTTLDRMVALKFLPAHLSSSEHDKARFIQEARAASALNHPNICTIHAIEECGVLPDGELQGGRAQVEKHLFIVMEYVDGQTLREKAGNISFKEAIEIGIQIADGLAAAHERGIVHRDIKPDNIMIRKDGIVQIMDFGLAKLHTTASKSARLTQEGSTVGTAGYMSPEQVEGRDIDHRSDIFSFGVVLYELFTGQLPFKGVHETALMYEIVNVDASPMSSIKPEINPTLDAIVLDCLEKDPKERCQSAAEVGRGLRRFKRESSKQHVSRMTGARPAAAPGIEVQPGRSHERLWRWGTALFFVTAIGLLLYYNLRTPAAPRTIRAQIPLPVKSSLSNLVGGGHIALSPDGAKLAFVAEDSAGNSALWVRWLNATSAQALPGTEGALFPFWSPDGGTIGFFADQKLKKISLSGGTPFTICEAPAARGGSWSLAGIIVFDPTSVGEIHQVSAAGGQPSSVTRLDSAGGERTHRWPVFLPDGKHFLFFIRKSVVGTGSESDSLAVGSIETRDMKKLIHGVSNAAYANGKLLFIRESALMAQTFDAERLEVEGEPVPIAQEIQFDRRFSKAAFSVSENGILVYQSTGERRTNEIALFDTSGDKIRSFGRPELYSNASLSMDARRIALEILDVESHNVDIWLYEIARGILTRFTFYAAYDIVPCWSPGGDRIVFSSDRKGRYDVYVKATTGSAPEELLSDFGVLNKFASDWTSDGRYILVTTTGDPKTKGDIWILPLTGDRKPAAFLQTEFFEAGGTFSPDMRWIAYVSDESGKAEVYVKPFVEPGLQDDGRALAKWQVSANGGTFAKWRNDGKAIFYGTPENKIMVADVRAEGASFEVQKIAQVMDLQAKGQLALLDMTADGKTILGTVSAPQAKSAPLTLVVNWDLELKNK